MAKDFAQRRRLERALVPLDFGYFVPAEIRFVGLHANADVMKAVVGEIRTRVTGRAVSLAKKELHAAIRRGRKGFFIARLELVVRSVARKDRSLKRGDRLGNRFWRRVATEHFLELFL